MQALRVGTCARPQHADQLAKQANSIPINNCNLFEEGLRTIVAKAASMARNYANMADGLAQAGLQKPTPTQGKQTNRKRKRESSLMPFRGENRWPASTGWQNRSSSKGRKPTTSHDRFPKSDHKSSRGSKSAADQTHQPKGRSRGSGTGRGSGKDPWSVSSLGPRSNLMDVRHPQDTYPTHQLPGPCPHSYWPSSSTGTSSVENQRSQWQVA